MATGLGKLSDKSAVYKSSSVKRAPVQCGGFTRAGKRCSITSESNMKDSNGRLACQPMKHGVGFCTIHLQLFNTKPAWVEDPLLFFLDFETSGLDVMTDHIVEIGVLCEHSEIFSTVVCPPVFRDGPAVHGISHEELSEGPSFTQAFHRLFRFCQNLAEQSVIEGDVSEEDEEETAPSVLKERPPDIVVIAHNGVNT